MTCHPDKVAAHSSADERATGALKWKQLCEAKSVLLQTDAAAAGPAAPRGNGVGPAAKAYAKAKAAGKGVR